MYIRIQKGKDLNKESVTPYKPSFSSLNFVCTMNDYTEC